MGTRAYLYGGQPDETATVLVTSPTATTTTITYAQVKNRTADVQYFAATVNGVEIVSKEPLLPNESRSIFEILGATLNAGQELGMTASATGALNVLIAGYQVSTA